MVKGELTPFLLRFGRAIPRAASMQETSFDQEKQEGLIYQSGRWRAALDADALDLASTKITKVSKETTDDE